jgi:hypothetical protein
MPYKLQQCIRADTLSLHELFIVASHCCLSESGPKSQANTTAAACDCVLLCCGPAGFLGATSTAVSTCPLPYLYSERYDTHELRALPHPPPPKARTPLVTTRPGPGPTMQHS